MLCEYGCGKEAHYQLKNGKWCCSSDYHKCSKLIEQNKNYYNNKSEIFECPYCYKKIRHTNNIFICKTHEDKCKKEYEKKQLLESKDISKYIKWYNNIIKYRQEHPLLEGYREKHHILPRSLGGTNSNSNLIYLTAREHYICHLLLVEIYSKDKKSYTKMLASFMMMKTRKNDNFKINSRLYEYYRIEYSKLKKNTGCGKNNNQYGKVWIYNVELKQSKVIYKTELHEYLNKGWIKGRYIKWSKLEKDKEIKQIRLNNIKIKEEKTKNNIEKYKKLYQQYISLSWEKFILITKYPYSLENLIGQFHRYLGKDFIPKRKANKNN